MVSEDKKTVIIGIGNSGRGDDGLGWSFLDEIKPFLGNDTDIEYRYQLQIEDAELISHYKEVYFVDAHKEVFPNGFNLSVCRPKGDHSFSTHALNPEVVMAISKSIYNKTPDSYILGISGEKFGLHIGLSQFAKHNLEFALMYFKEHKLACLK